MSDCPKPAKIPYVWTEGNTLPEITFVLPGDLLVADFTITLWLERPDDTTITQPAVDLGGSQGKFAWLATDLIAGLEQRAQIDRVDIAGDVQSSDIMLIDVRQRVGS